MVEGADLVAARVELHRQVAYLELRHQAPAVRANWSRRIGHPPAACWAPAPSAARRGRRRGVRDRCRGAAVLLPSLTGPFLSGVAGVRIRLGDAVFHGSGSIRLKRAGLAVAVMVGATVATVPFATVASAAPSWSAPATIDPGGAAPVSVSCPSTSFCAAVDGSGDALFYDGSGWSAPAPVDAGDGPLFSVSSAAATFCVAGDGNGQVFTYDGTSWSPPDDVNGIAVVNSISCPTTTFCVALAGDAGGTAAMYDGTSWTGLTIDTNSVTGMNSVSCPTPTFCAAADSSGGVVTYDGASWSAPTSVDTASESGLASVSCTSSAFCAAVDSAGNAFTYDGASWAGPTDIDASNDVDSVSCTSPTFCMAVDAATPGNALSYDGTGWSAPTAVDAAGGLSSVSCVSAAFCAAVDSADNALLYNAPALSITTTADATPVSDGTTIGYTTTVANAAVAGTAKAKSVTVGDPLPAGPGIDWAINPGVGEPGNCTINGAVGSQVLHCSDGDLAPGSEAVVDVQSPTTSASAGSYPTTATASATNTASIQASATIVVEAPGLSITETADATPVSDGTTIGFTTTVADSAAAGTGTATGVTVGDPLPAGPGIDWAINPGVGEPGNCTINGAVGSQVLHCNDGDLGPESEAVVDVQSPTTTASTGSYPTTATASATNAASVHASATTVVEALPLSITTTSLPDATVGRSYSAPVAATGGTTPYTWSISAGSLPGGLTINAATGAIVGGPTTPGVSHFTVKVTDAATPTPQTATAALSITTAPAPPIVSKVSPPTGDTGGGTSVTITGSGFTGATEVDFGTSGALDVSVVNDSTITATAPHEPAGTVDVVVHTPDGDSVTHPADQFTYTEVQSPVTVPCDPDCTASESTDLNNTSVTVTGTTGTSSSQVSLVVNTDTVACGGASYPTAVATLSATNFSSTSLLTVKELVGNEPSTKGVKVCFEPTGAPSGRFLPPCRRGHVPCVVSLTEESGSVLATFLVPANDPRFWTGGGPVVVKSFTPKAAAPGSPVTVKGKNLTGAVSVVMGGVPATITSTSPTRLVVTVPDGAATGLISVTAASGTAISASAFTVT